jgi:hypothetical protein
MIVIPPSDESNEYFIRFANLVWNEYILKRSDIENEIKYNSHTFIITYNINIDDEDTKPVLVNFHYRFVKGDIYCFIEECKDENVA